MTATKTYRITSSAGLNMGTFAATSEQAALDAMARDAGYRDAAHAAEVAGPFDGTIEEVAAITVHDYQTGEELRKATYADLHRAWHDLDSGRMTADTGTFLDEDGVTVFLEGLPYGTDEDGDVSLPYDPAALHAAARAAGVAEGMPAHSAP